MASIMYDYIIIFTIIILHVIVVFIVIFIRNYDDGKPMITLTVNKSTTIGKLKKIFSELCK